MTEFDLTIQEDKGKIPFGEVQLGRFFVHDEIYWMKTGDSSALPVATSLMEPPAAPVDFTDPEALVRIALCHCFSSISARRRAEENARRRQPRKKRQALTA